MDVDPAQDARNARKARVAKNERQRLQNIARAQVVREEREQRKHDIDRTLASTRTSTASMGKFDKQLEGDKKVRGVKRKVGVDNVFCVGDVYSGYPSLSPPKHQRSMRNNPLLLSYQNWKARLNGLEKNKVVMMYSMFGKQLGQSAEAKVVLHWDEKQLASQKASGEANDDGTSISYWSSYQG